MNSIKELKDYLQSLPKLNDKDAQKRKSRAKEDFRFFVITYLGHHIGLDNQKGEVRINESSLFRQWVYKELPHLSENKIIIKAYRGAAKTTLISRLFSLWQICRGKTRYCVLISSTLDLAKEGIDLIKTELEDNANLRADFDVKIGDVWNNEEIVFSLNGVYCKIKSFGAGKKIRGTNFLSIRPDLIICDDIENDENIQSKAQRDKLYNWFNKAILKLPSRLNPHYQILIVGTTLHYDSLLQRLSARNDFLSKNFPLVLQFPTNLEELTKENIESFIPKGLKLDDSKAISKDVLSDYLEDSASFYSEFQNLPLDKENAPLSTYSTYEVLPEGIDSITIGIDPSMGKSRGDYFGLSALFYNKNEKRLYATASGYKVAPDKMIEKIIAYYLRLNKNTAHITIAVEEIAFQEFFKTTLKAKMQSLGLFVPIMGIKNTANKYIRLDSLSPLLTQGDMRIDSNAHLLREELDTYPKCAHDDLLDSIDIALQAFNKNARVNYKAINKAQKAYKDLFQRSKEF